jgi:hypothetical protein
MRQPPRLWSDPLLTHHARSVTHVGSSRSCEAETFSQERVRLADGRATCEASTRAARTGATESAMFPEHLRARSVCGRRCSAQGAFPGPRWETGLPSDHSRQAADRPVRSGLTSAALTRTAGSTLARQRRNFLACRSWSPASAVAESHLLVEDYIVDRCGVIGLASFTDRIVGVDSDAANIRGIVELHRHLNRRLPARRNRPT